jgi:hypothetical protein
MVIILNNLEKGKKMADNVKPNEAGLAWSLACLQCDSFLIKIDCSFQSKT